MTSSEDLSARVTAALALARVPARDALCEPATVDVEAWDHVGDPITEALVGSIRARRLTRMDVLNAARQLESEGDRAAIDFFADVTHVPLWADFEAMRAGAALGRRSALGIAFAANGAQTFTYYSAAQNEVFALTGRLMPSGDYERRLWESSTGLVGALDVDGLRPGGVEWERWLRIRIMHTRVRHGLLSSGKWQGEAAPVSAAATAAGAYLLGSYRASVCSVFAGASEEELESFSLAWRWIAKLLGAPPELLGADPTTQLHMELRLMEHFYDPDSLTRDLTAAGWVGLSTSFFYSLLPKGVHEAIGRYVLDSAVRYPVWTYRRVARANNPVLSAQLAATVAKTQNLPDDFGIPRHPLLTRVVAICAFVVRTLMRATQLPGVAERRDRLFYSITRWVVRRGLSGRAADYDTHVDTQAAA